MASSAEQFIILLLVCAAASARCQSAEEGFISLAISEAGLAFAKDLLIRKAISYLTPLELPLIEKSVKVPLVGEVHMVLSDISLYELDVSSSHVNSGETGVSLIVSGASAKLSTKWAYSYSTWLVPIVIRDEGYAHVQAEGVQVGLTVKLKSHEGSLGIFLVECGCHVSDITIKLDGGASWLYQGIVDAFQDMIAASVEEAIWKKLKEEIVNTDRLLRNASHEIPVSDVAEFNATLVDEPSCGDSSIGFEINGLFSSARKRDVPRSAQKKPGGSVSCDFSSKMGGISLRQDVVNSALSVYFKEGLIHRVIDKIPEQSLMNTAGWRLIIPQLYKHYPDDDMNLNVSASSPPSVNISDRRIEAAIDLDVTIDVLDSGAVVPVACIGTSIRVSGSAGISKNNVVGSVWLDSFLLFPKWSNIGDLHVSLIQSVASAILKTVLLPYLNLRLNKGIPLPAFHGFRLENAEILSGESAISVCSNVAIA